MWSHQTIKRLVLDLASKVAGTPFYGSATLYHTVNADWKNDVGLDSIELMQLSAYVNSFFNLLEMKNPPYLLASRKVDEWVDQIYQAKQEVNDSITFLTSGTTGTEKAVRHRVSFLNREILFLASLFQNTTQVIPYVPSYTIYGFLLTIGLPEKSAVPVLYPSEIDWTQLPATSLIVANPFHWQLILKAYPSQLHCCGVSSAAPLYSHLYQAIIDRNVSLTELYGSTETSGVAFRRHWQEPFTLFPYLKFPANQGDGAIEDRDTFLNYSLMDNIDLVGENTFNISGRKDKRIKIAGKLADLDYIQSVIEKIPNVQKCTVIAKAAENEVIIQAHLCLQADNANRRTAVRKRIRSLLKPHETPKIIDFWSSE